MACNAGPTNSSSTPLDINSLPCPPGFSRGAGSAVSSSKCHNSNTGQNAGLTGSQAKTAHALRINAETLIQTYGIDSCGFLTLTVGDSTPGGFLQVHDAAEASRRFNSLRSGVLGDLFAAAVVVTERHKSGAIHFHLLVALSQRDDIRSGFDFRGVSLGNYSSVSAKLKAIWAKLRAVLPGYGFGRAELKPIKKDGGAVACYVAKYLAKNVANRHPGDKGKKLVRYLGFNKEQLKPNDFEWNTEHAKGWRARVVNAAKLVGLRCGDLAVKGPAHVERLLGTWVTIRAKKFDATQLREVIGSKWAFLVNRLLQGLQLVTGDIQQMDYAVRELLRNEMGRLVGLNWCKKFEFPTLPQFLGEDYTWREFNDYMESFPA